MKPQKFILSRWFLVVMFIMAFILPPYAAKDFVAQNIGNIVNATLSNSFVRNLLPYSTLFQIVVLIFFVGLFFFKNRVGKAFTIFVGISYSVYALVQNIAITDQFGLSMILSNIILCLMTSFVWLSDVRSNKNSYTFNNFNKKNAWLIIVALFCLWSMDFSGTPDLTALFFHRTCGSIPAILLYDPHFFDYSYLL